MNNNSKRIIKNTGILYVRMLFLMFIGIYTSRVILQNLGVVDYGIYNVVGGLTGMFAFFSSSLSNALQRFLSVEIGKDSVEGATKVFSQFFFIFIAFVIVILLALETFGYWYVANKLNIPPDRLDAAVWVFHFTSIALCFTFIGIVFNSMIIAHEDMSFYSYLGIFEGVAKLGIAYLILFSSHDKLIVYALLLLVSVILSRIACVIWCIKKYDECRLIRYFSKSSLKEMGTFFSWNFIGAIIYMTKDQFVNILMNLFFGPAINAARGVSYQLNGVLTHFTSSIYTSVQPQMVKSFASGDMSYMHKLIFASSRYSVYAFWTMALTVAINVEFLLNIWLVEVPPYTAVFTVWILGDTTLALLTDPQWSATIATGKIRNYTLLGNGVLLLVFPISYIVLRAGGNPVSVFIVTFAVRCLQVMLVVREANKLVSFGIRKYVCKVMIPILRVCIISVILPVIANSYFNNNWTGLFAKSIISIASCILTIWFIGISINEKDKVKSFIENKIKH